MYQYMPVVLLLGRLPEFGPFIGFECINPIQVGSALKTQPAEDGFGDRESIESVQFRICLDAFAWLGRTCPAGLSPATVTRGHILSQSEALKLFGSTVGQLLGHR